MAVSASSLARLVYDVATGGTVDAGSGGAAEAVDVVVVDDVTGLAVALARCPRRIFVFPQMGGPSSLRIRLPHSSAGSPFQ